MSLDFDSDNITNIIVHLKNLIQSGFEWVNIQTLELSNNKTSNEDIHIPSFLEYAEQFLKMTGETK